MRTKEATDAGSDFITSRELIIRGISETAQREGRKSGELKYSSPDGGGPDTPGATYTYRKSDVDAWLAPSQGKPADEPKGKSTRTASQATATQPAAGQATRQWESSLQSLISRGMSRAQAARELAKTKPALQRAFLIESNANRPAAQERIK